MKDDLMETNKKLERELERIRNEHRKALLKTSARVVLGSSVIRVFQKGTKPRLQAVLESIAVDELTAIEKQEEYRQWFEEHLSKVADEIRATNPKSITPRIYPGYK